MLVNETGVIITTMKLKIQLALWVCQLNASRANPVVRVAYLVDSALDGARIRSGTISAGYNQVIPSHPIPKKVLNTKRKTACPIPAWLSLRCVNR